MESDHRLPPTTTKRIHKKAREVSSRYLSTPSPSPFLSARPNTHTQKTRKSSSDSNDDEFRFPNENSNQNPNTPFSFNANNKTFGTQRKTAIKLFGDNGPPNVPKKGRSATPFASYSTKGAILTNTLIRNGRINSNGKSVNSDCCSDASSVVSDSEIEKCSISSNGGFCESPPVMGSRCSRNQDGFRSSMPEADLLPSISSRRSQSDSNENNSGDNSSAVCRSLNLALTSSQNNPFQNKTGRYVPSRICLPPKLNGEAKKGKKQQDIHMLKLLQNKYLQWRFINAKTKEAVDARTTAAEKLVYGLSVKIAEMKNDVAQKRIEVEMLRRMEDLSLILGSQMPYLDKYSDLERNYCSSLTGIIKALQDCSLRLPTTENVKVNVNELKQVFDSTTSIFNSLSPSLERIIPKTAEVKDVVLNLSEVASMERALVEECGNLLSQAHNLQMTECSLRGQLMQAKQSRKA